MKNLHKFMFYFLAASSFSSMVAMFFDDIEERKIIFQKVPDDVKIKQYLLDKMDKKNPTNSFNHVFQFEKAFVVKIYEDVLKNTDTIIQKMASTDLSYEEKTILYLYCCDYRKRFDDWDVRYYIAHLYNIPETSYSCHCDTKEIKEAAQPMIDALKATGEDKEKIYEQLTALRAKKQQQK